MSLLAGCAEEATIGARSSDLCCLLCELVSAPLSPQLTLAPQGTVWQPVHGTFPMCVTDTHVTNVGASKKIILVVLATRMELWRMFLTSLHGGVAPTICLVQIPCYVGAPHFGRSRKTVDFQTFRRGR